MYHLRRLDDRGSDESVGATEEDSRTTADELSPPEQIMQVPQHSSPIQHGKQSLHC